ncbi:hypothetical protein D9752_15440 (plasmid) [Lactiplantibacillus plantarum]|nr:hypothetical protein D9752_15440 [Lactiplantibacillus plantarum]
MMIDKTAVAGSELPVFGDESRSEIFRRSWVVKGNIDKLLGSKAQRGLLCRYYGIGDDLVRLDGQTEFPDQEAL